MKTSIFAGFLILSMLLPTAAGAVPKGKTLTWESSEGTAVFAGKSHAGSGLKCKDCHKGLFKRKHGTAKMTMKELNEGKYCGSCHDGKRAFDTTSETNCRKCHSGK